VGAAGVGVAAVGEADPPHAQKEMRVSHESTGISWQRLRDARVINSPSPTRRRVRSRFTLLPRWR
jgi:hypothetical protein